MEIEQVRAILDKNVCPLVAYYCGIPIEEYSKEDIIRILSLTIKHEQARQEEQYRQMDFLRKFRGQHA